MSQEIPASPAPPPPRLEIDAEVSDQEVTLHFGDRRWRVRGLKRNMSLEQLKVNLLVAREGESPRFHVDSLDLYSARHRAAYVKLAAINAGSAHELRRAAERIRGAPLVLDLRGCRSTLAHDTALVADLFRTEGPMGASATRARTTAYHAGPDVLFDAATTAVLGSAFALVAALIIGTALRIAIFARREEIYVMRLVGATNGFIRRPFLLEGALAGFLGGAIAPGPDLLADSLARGTGRLPRVTPVAGARALGTDTPSALLAGIAAALRGAARELLEGLLAAPELAAFGAVSEAVPIFLVGGAAPFLLEPDPVHPGLRTDTPDLVHRGLWHAWHGGA